jgi:transcriptional regulator with XRE-family HTH domain
MGMLWDLIQRHIDNAPYPPSERQIAAKLGVTPNTLKIWRDLKRLPSRENLEAIANLVGVRYAVALDAALRDTGYHEDGRPAVAAVRPLRPISRIEAELQVALADLQEFNELKVSGRSAESKRREIRARVDALEAELVASRIATGESETVANL